MYNIIGFHAIPALLYAQAANVQGFTFHKHTGHGLLSAIIIMIMFNTDNSSYTVQ